MIVRRLAGYMLAGTAVLACPCHLLILLGLAAPALGGSALGVALSANPQLVVLGATAYFALALAGAWWLLSRSEAAQPGAGPQGGAAAPAGACCPPLRPAAPRRLAES